MVVYLFDIDGTLVKTGGAGGMALMEAFAETFRVRDPSEVPFSGRTDRGIAQSLFQLHGIEDTVEHWELLRQEYLQRLRHYLPRHQGEVLPGVHPLLDRLAQHPGAHMGLLTGNTQDGARMKLEHYQLWQYFAFGGFGDRHADRDAVAAEALAACRQYIGNPVRPDQVWVVGDTPLDIRCARAIGARVVAVATGWHDRRRLEDAHPDLLVDDLAQTEMILEQTLAEAA